MILGMSIQTLNTTLHVILSLIGIVTGLVVVQPACCVRTLHA